MKKLLMLFQCIFFSLVANAQASISQDEDQRVTIVGTNVTLEAAFKQITDKTRLEFMFDNSKININMKVSLNYVDKPLTIVLNGILSPFGIEWSIRNRTILLRKQENAAGALPGEALTANILPVIKGRVVDGYKQPISGATIIIKGTGQGTTTDQQGNFSLHNVKKGAELHISSMGYESRSITAVGSSLLVTLGLYVRNLEEIPVRSTGYQQVPKERSTGSFVQLDKQLLNRRVSSDVLDRLEDVTPGVLFNQNPNRLANEPKISIRGRSTIFANAEPLIVVGNFPYESSISNLNPNDIESVTVLKDASAASIWGVRAGNGVIVITTKQGKLQQPPRVSFTSNVTVGVKPNVRYAPQLTAAEYIENERFLFDNRYYDPILRDLPKNVQSNVVDLLEKKRNGSITEETLMSKLHDLAKIDTRDYINKYFYQLSVKQQYAINLSGGGVNNTYYISAGYDRNRANWVGDHDERYTLTIDNKYYLLQKKLELSSSILYTGTKVATSPPYSPKYPYERPADDNGNALPVIANQREQFVDTAGMGLLLDWRYYPLNERHANTNTRSNDYRINLGLAYTIANGLKASARFQYGRGTNNEFANQALSSYYTRDLVNSYSQVDYLHHTVYRPVPLGDIVTVSDNSFTLNNYRLQAEYDRTFGNHSLSAIAGFEVRDRAFAFSTQGRYGYDSNTATDIPVDYFTNYYRIDLGDSARIPEISNQGYGTDRFRSYYINAAYTFRKKYTISASARKDASNLFGVKSNQKGLPLWSVGAKWNLSDEEFYHINWVSKLVIRLTTGLSGNVDKTVSAFTTVQDAGTDPIYGTRYANIVNPSNPFLRWEQVRMTNAALDFTIVRDVIDGSIEAYWKRSTDLIANAPIAPQTGNIQIRTNAANMKTNGVELNLTSKNIKRKLRWETSCSFSHVNNIVTKYKTRKAANHLYIVQNFLNPLEGKPYSSIFSFRNAGLNSKGRLLSYLDGHISDDYTAIYNSTTPDEMVFMGSAVPTIFGAIRNTFAYRAFSLSLNISYKAGYYFRRSSVDYTSLAKGEYSQPDFNRRWKMPGDEKTTYVPARIYPFSRLQDQIYKYSDILVEKGDHVRLQDIQFSWLVPPIATGMGAPVTGRLYCYIGNIGLLWKATDFRIDPDAASTDGMPAPLTVSIGFNANF